MPKTSLYNRTEFRILATVSVTAEIFSILIVPPEPCKRASRLASPVMLFKPSLAPVSPNPMLIRRRQEWQRELTRPCNGVTFVTRFEPSASNLVRRSSYDQDSASGGIRVSALGTLYFFAPPSWGVSRLLNETRRRKRRSFG